MACLPACLPGQRFVSPECFKPMIDMAGACGAVDLRAVSPPHQLQVASPLIRHAPLHTDTLNMADTDISITA